MEPIPNRVRTWDMWKNLGPENACATTLGRCDHHKITILQTMRLNCFGVDGGCWNLNVFQFTKIIYISSTNGFDISVWIIVLRAEAGAIQVGFNVLTELNR